MFQMLEDNTNVFKGQMQVVFKLECEREAIE
jgi:hypothetical protein